MIILNIKKDHIRWLFLQILNYILCVLDKEGLANGTVDNLKNLNDDLLILDTYDHEIKNLSQIFKMKEFLDKNRTIKPKDIICLIDAMMLSGYQIKKGRFKIISWTKCWSIIWCRNCLR